MMLGLFMLICGFVCGLVIWFALVGVGRGCFDRFALWTFVCFRFACFRCCVLIIDWCFVIYCLPIVITL